jgi:hypothetical protein
LTTGMGRSFYQGCHSPSQLHESRASYVKAASRSDCIGGNIRWRVWRCYAGIRRYGFDYHDGEFLSSRSTKPQKTVEITRSKASVAGLKVPSTIQVCREIYAREGYRGLNKGVNAVALRQMTTWGSRMGITRFIETTTRRVTGKESSARLSGLEKVVASCGGGALSCWNQPLEVIRVEMQKVAPSSHSPLTKATMAETAKKIYRTDGVLAFYRGITPRVMLAASVTTFMVAGGDWVKEMMQTS